MPKLREHQAPAYRLHKPSGRAVVTFNGRDIYLGVHGTAASRREYDRLIGEWRSGNGHLPPAPSDSLLIVEVIERYWLHATKYYRNADGTPTSEIDCLKLPLKILRRLYGNTPAAKFGPLALESVRDEMIRLGWCRKSINKHVARIQRLFRWAVSKELIGHAVYGALSAVAGLEAGRSDARETKPVRPADEAIVDATLPHLSTVVASMVRLQRLTGARSGEICVMRTCDIDTTSAVWTYTPIHHKNAYRGHTRVIHIGPQAQELLKPYLTPLNPTAFLFRPADAVAEMRERRTAARKSPMRANQLTEAKSNPKRTPGERYCSTAYSLAIRRACLTAFPPPPHLAKASKETTSQWLARLTPEQRAELKAWRKRHHWHPHQIRHSVGTMVRRKFGTEVARTALGHATLSTTEIYAEADAVAAANVALQIG